jgi:hypothetical protein
MRPAVMVLLQASRVLTRCRRGGAFITKSLSYLGRRRDGPADISSELEVSGQRKRPDEYCPSRGDGGEKH